MVYRRILPQLNPVSIIFPTDDHVIVARGNQCRARPRFIAMHRLAHFHGAYLIQAVGKRLGKNRRDVLHDQNGRQTLGQSHEHVLDRFGAAGGGAKHDELA